MQKVALHTLGCKLNFAETSTIGRAFKAKGFTVVESDEPSDVFILNTCSVTERADRECRQIVRRILRRSPHTYVIVTGCYAQLHPEEIGAIEGVDLILGTNEKFDAITHGAPFLKSSATQLFVSCIDEATFMQPAYSADVGGRTRAFLKIQDGCDYSCSFCTIPRARGSSRSMPPEDVLRQAARLVADGYREIVLTGVNVGDYRPTGGEDLFHLMRELDGLDGIDRIRISSLEPNLLTKEMVDFVLSSRTFCHHFHIPLQSGSDAVLGLMRRRYRRDQYRELVEYIKSRDGNAGIGADVIVGFPGETEDLFDETYRFLCDLPVTYLHVFTYSERDGTPAAGYPAAVEPRLRFRRNHLLRSLSEEKRNGFYRSLIGTTAEVLFEHAQPDGTIAGLTSSYVRVASVGDARLTNTFQDVRVRRVEGDRCWGEISHHFNDAGGMLSNLQTEWRNDSTHVSPSLEFR